MTATPPPEGVAPFEASSDAPSDALPVAASLASPEAAQAAAVASEPRVLRVWASIELAIACVALVTIFVAVMWQVVSRFSPTLSWPGVGELANYSLIVMTFIMVGYLIGRNGHITIQIVDYVVKGKAFVVVKAVSAAVTALICAVLAYESAALIITYQARSTSALEIPLWILYTVPLAGFTSGVVRAVIRIFTANRPDPVFNAAEAS